LKRLPSFALSVPVLVLVLALPMPEAKAMDHQKIESLLERCPDLWDGSFQKLPDVHKKLG
jgi:hypothetical protein